MLSPSVLTSSIFNIQRRASRVNPFIVLCSVMAAIGMMDASRPGYVLFLSDGNDNTYTVTDDGLAGILEECNSAGARVFFFGVGHYLNEKLMERFSGISGGATAYVDRGEAIEGEASRFFSKLTSPVLASPALGCSLPLNRMGPTRLTDHFGGEQIASVGRYPEGGRADFVLTGFSGGAEKEFSYSFELSDGPVPEAEFLGPLWAMRRSAQLLDELEFSDLSGETGYKLLKELTRELFSLARAYRVLNPLTSLLATEDRDLERKDENLDAVASLLKNLGVVSGVGKDIERQLRGMTPGELAATRSPFGLDRRRPSRSLNRVIEEEFCEKTPLPRHDPLMGIVREWRRRNYDWGRAVWAGRLAKRNLRKFFDEDECVSPPPGVPRPPETIGGRDFFLQRGGLFSKTRVLVEGELSDEEIKGAKEVAQFSAEFFALASEIPA
jgi:hypothetical protein